MLSMFVAYYFLGTSVVKKRHDNKALASQLAVKSDELAQMLKPSQDLDARLAEAEEYLADAISAIPTELNSTLVINDILKLAEACQVKAVLLTAGPWTAGDTKQGYHVFKISMSLEGNFTNVHFFLDQMENVEFKTIIVEGLTVTQVDTTSGAVNVNLSLAIYSRYTPGN